MVAGWTCMATNGYQSKGESWKGNNHMATGQPIDNLSSKHEDVGLAWNVVKCCG